MLSHANCTLVPGKNGEGASDAVAVFATPVETAAALSAVSIHVVLLFGEGLGVGLRGLGADTRCGTGDEAVVGVGHEAAVLRVGAVAGELPLLALVGMGERPEGEEQDQGADHGDLSR